MKYLHTFNGLIVERKTFKGANIKQFLDFVYKEIPKSDYPYYFISLRDGNHTTLINP